MIRHFCLWVSGFFMLAASALAWTVLAAPARVPNVSLKVTFQQKEDGRLDKGLHLFELFCWDGQCSMTSLSLNQCSALGSSKPSFYPKVVRTSTQEGNLRVLGFDGVLDVLETADDLGGESTIRLRIGYAHAGNNNVATKVTSFTGGFVKNSIILKKVLTVEYVPLPREWQDVIMDCPASLPGVSRN